MRRRRGLKDSITKGAFDCVICLVGPHTAFFGRHDYA